MTIKELGVIGLGYVGLPLAMEFCQSNIGVLGVDVDEPRVQILRDGGSYIGDIPADRVKAATDAGLFRATTNFDELREVKAISICVPTPLGKSREPDVSAVISVAERLSEVLVRDQTVILESTVYPGATEEIVAPILERSGLKAGRDFKLAFSPERIDPGNGDVPLARIPKIVGGVNEASTARAAEIYGRVFDEVTMVGSTREAEMAKLLENTFRAVNIGLVNELAMMAHGMGIDIWKVIDAAATKPFGFMPFYPGPGWGGHCIPVDPFYLTWRARIDGYESGFIDHAGRINTRMPAYVVERINDLLNERGLPLMGTRILLLGVAYKRDVADVRESPALEVGKLLAAAGANLAYHDPHVDHVRLDGMELDSMPLDVELLEEQDCVVILTDHRAVDYDVVRENSTLVFDTRNVMGRLELDGPNIVRL